MTDKLINKHDLTRGSLIQVIPGTAEIWDGCILIVDEVKSWGAQAYVRIPGSGNAYMRLKHEQFIKVGQAAFEVESHD